ncbi:TetR family transcriptional regulator [Gordonia sp. DT30]|uniref:TetR family transcriptional regulator n=1 Tax=Gordonia sp. DT30 TaxID=3416546 RepID=UPI003CF928A5
MSTKPASLRERRTAQTRTELSAVAADLFIRDGLADTTVERIAAEAGVSTRTFHRYFVTKEEAIAPTLDACWHEYVDAVDRQPGDRQIVDVLVSALTSTFDGQLGRRHRELLRSLPESPALKPIWESVHARSAEGLRTVLASRLGLDPSSLHARFAATCVVAANRLAVEEWAADTRASVPDVTRRCLELLGAGVLQTLAPMMKEGEQ